MSGIAGSGVREPNIVLRFCILIFLGTLGMGIALSWRSSLLLASEYQEMPTTKKTLDIKKRNQIKQQKILSNQKSINNN